MAIRVLSTHDETVTYEGAIKWVIDDAQQLHIVGEDGNIASYGHARWVQVQKVEDEA